MNKEIHCEAGKSTYLRSTMYVAVNRHTDNHVTKIRDENGKTVSACIKDMDFIPNFDIKLAQGLISSGGGG